MASGSVLEVLQKGSKKFVKAPGTLIKNGEAGKIFEDSQGNIYAMGTDAHLEVLYKGEQNFVKAKGHKGTYNRFTRERQLVEDSQGNVYIFNFEFIDSNQMLNAELKVLYKGTKEFVKAPGNSIFNGNMGIIFKDSQGNIYAMGMGSSTGKSNFVVLYKGEKEFKNVPGISEFYGYSGVIFEDSQGNIYAKGQRDSFYVLYKGKKEFEKPLGTAFFQKGYENGITTNYNLFIGAAKIFEDSKGNIYVLSAGSTNPLLISS